LRRLLLVCTATLLCSYAANFVWNWHLHQWSSLQVNAMFVGVIVGPPLLFWLAALASDWRAGYRLAALDNLAHNHADKVEPAHSMPGPAQVGGE